VGHRRADVFSVSDESTNVTDSVDTNRLQYLSEISLEISNPAAHAQFRGITG
jgi:hypothetical protein